MMLMIMTTMGSCSNTWTARFPQVATNPPLNDTRALISFPALTCTDSLQFFSALIQAPFYESLSNSLMSSISAGTAFIWSYVIKPYMVDGDILSKPVWGLIIYDHTGFDHISPSTIYIYTIKPYIWSNHVPPSPHPHHRLLACRSTLRRKKMMVVDLK